MSNVFRKKELEPLREQLLARREHLNTRHFNDELSDLAQSTQVTSDETEAASLAETAEVNSLLLQNQGQEAQAVEEALERMRDGYYGKCVDCTGDISPARLKANPSVSRCIDCQRNLEKQQNGTHRNVVNLLQREDWFQ